MIKHFVFILSLVFCFSLFAGKIEKGFKALEIYNYFDAKRLFEKALKKDAVAANYGLSIIYLREDNPFYNIDSAYNCIVRSTENYSSVKTKKKLKYNLLGADSSHIYRQRDLVSNALYKQVKTMHTIGAYQVFIDKNNWSTYLDSVIYFRDNLAFETALQLNTAKAFNGFLTTYPTSFLSADAKSAYDRLTYQEQTVNDKFIDYVLFVKNYPNSPYRPDAEDQIYKIYTETGSLESYKKFIEDYPQNRNLPIAWKKLFNTYLQDNYSSGSIQAFMEEFKEYPFKEELLEQLKRVDEVLYPIKNRNKWGYINENGSIYIAPVFQEAEAFFEGLAIVSLEDKYGFVNKTGNLVIDAIFDDAYKMNEGHAVVEFENGWGLINRSGEFVIQPQFEDLGNLNEGLCYFSVEDKYGYFDGKGIVRLKAQYARANDFVAGKAIVSTKAGYGLIDPFGTAIIPFKYERLKRFGKNYIAKFNGKWGQLAEKKDTTNTFKYEYIGDLFNNRAIVELNGLFNYIDQNGIEILDDWLETYPEYRQLAVFSDGVAKIKFQKGYNFIDSLGKKIFTRDKLELGSYGNYIAVKKGTKWGYVNKRGATVIPYNYTMASSFKNKLAKAGGAPLVGVINKKGVYQVEPYFEKLNFFNDTVLIAKSRGNYGILLTSGDTLLNFGYVSIEPFSNEVVLLITKQEVYYYQIKNNKFIRKEEK